MGLEEGGGERVVRCEPGAVEGGAGSGSGRPGGRGGALRAQQVAVQRVVRAAAKHWASGLQGDCLRGVGAGCVGVGEWGRRGGLR